VRSRTPAYLQFPQRCLFSFSSNRFLEQRWRSATSPNVGLMEDFPLTLPTLSRPRPRISRVPTPVYSVARYLGTSRDIGECYGFVWWRLLPLFARRFPLPACLLFICFSYTCADVPRTTHTGTVGSDTLNSFSLDSVIVNTLTASPLTQTLLFLSHCLL